MEERTVKVNVGKAGGTASKNSVYFSLKLPVKWGKDMGITSEKRDVVLSYDEEKKEITIRNAE